MNYLAAICSATQEPQDPEELDINLTWRLTKNYQEILKAETEHRPIIYVNNSRELLLILQHRYAHLQFIQIAHRDDEYNCYGEFKSNSTDLDFLKKIIKRYSHRRLSVNSENASLLLQKTPWMQKNDYAWAVIDTHYLLEKYTGRKDNGDDTYYLNYQETTVNNVRVYNLQNLLSILKEQVSQTLVPDTNSQSHSRFTHRYLSKNKLIPVLLNFYKILNLAKVDLLSKSNYCDLLPQIEKEIPRLQKDKKLAFPETKKLINRLRLDLKKIKLKG